MRSVAMTFTSNLVKGLRYCLKQMMRLESYYHRTFDRELHNQNVIRSTRKYNMVTASDESYYATQYWQRIQAFLETEAVAKTGRFLDVGCGQGRLALPLAKWCATQGSVTAVDISAHAIDEARHYAAEQHIHNIDFKVTDLFDYLKTLPDQSLDGVFLLEVSFFLPNYEQALTEIKRILKPNGFFIGSFRPQYFNLLNCLQQGLWHSIDTLLEKRTGTIMGGATQFNWHTVQELKTLVEKELELDVKHISGIGVCSGIPGDPHAAIARPGQLSTAEQEKLMQVEASLGQRLPEAGRYILLMAQKRGVS